MQLELQQLDRRYEGLRARDPQRERRLLASLSECGQQAPIVVVRGSEAGRYVVVDGFKRIRSLSRLKADTVLGTCWELSEPEALIVVRQLCGSERASALEQGWLLRELVDRFALHLDVLARRFGRSTSWVSRRLGLVRDLPQLVQDSVREGQLVPHTAMKYLLPLARANANDCIGLLTALRGARPSSRAMGRLYAAYVSGDEWTRARLVADPQLFLRVDEERRRRPSDAAGQLLADLRAVVAILRRVRRGLEDRANDTLSADTVAQAGVLLTRARGEIERLGRAWPEENADAERVDTPGSAAAATGGARDADDRAGARDLARRSEGRAGGGDGGGPGAGASLAS